ncbi:TPA: hypothetical protein N0F65_000920 [Lagenidium giganteum]|uniref:Glucosidase 2 subunit beta n=1 Tax=Lagenidium giganteum TaxID=4803 RepID=A0AAV2YLH7_9STRA|nr:TPA: hypothetical protein N0F65_000920 [Lagenidium giganteum]
MIFGALFSCDEGSKKFDLTRINDNFCDCEDGSDEPGTSACSHTSAKFHCANTGFFAKDVPTSQVNDMICGVLTSLPVGGYVYPIVDCCDGSDEYSSGAQCPNTCAADMNVFKEEKKEAIKAWEGGLEQRKAFVANATRFLADDREHVETLRASIASHKVMVEQLEARVTHEELAETKEKLEMSKATKREMLQSLGLLDLTQEQLGFIILELANAAYSKDDLLKYIRLEREALGDSQLEQDEAAYKVRDAERQKETERIEALREERRKAKEAKEAEAAEGEAPTEVAVEGEEEELKTPEKEERPVKLLFDRMKEFEKHERPEAKEARDKHRETKSQLSDEESQLSKLEKQLEKTYGEEDVLYSVRDDCIEAQSGQYIYSMCFFGAAKQDSTSLGRMETYEGDNVLKFTGGTTCWNGPARSLTVTMECGELPMELHSVDEPSTCVYRAKLRTPIACDPNKNVLDASASTSSSSKPHHMEFEVSATL